MKKTLPIVFAILFIEINLTLAQSSILKEKSTVDIEGNSNIVKVIQGNDVKVYDMLDDDQVKEFLDYLRALPGIKQDITQILNYDKQTFNLINKLSQKINQTKSFNTDEFLEKLQNYIKENDQLKLENDSLRGQTNDFSFSLILEKAGKHLDILDNEGYQKVLEDFKLKGTSALSKNQIELATASYLQSKNSVSNFNFNLALKQINESLNYDSKNVDYLINKAEILYSLFNYRECIDVYNVVLNITKIESILAEAYNAIGMAYYYIGEYDLALKSFFDALPILEKIYGNVHGKTSRTLHNIGMAYSLKSEFQNAILYFNKVLEIDMKLWGKDDIMSAPTYGNIGATYHNNGEFDKSLEYYSKSLTITINAHRGNDLSVATIYSWFGHIYNHKGDFEKSIEYYKKALLIIDNLTDNKSLIAASTNKGLGEVYYSISNSDSSLKYLNLALPFYQKILGEDNSETVDIFNEMDWPITILLNMIVL